MIGREWQRSPESEAARSSIFVSMPITENLTSDGSFRSERELTYRAVFTELENFDILVESAALHEDWGRIKMSPEEFIRYDYEALYRASALLAVTSTKLTRDIYLEIGFAAARGIPILVVKPWSARVTFMIDGLVNRGQAEVCSFDSESEIPGIINQDIPRLLPNARDDRPPLGHDQAQSVPHR